MYLRYNWWVEQSPLLYFQHALELPSKCHPSGYSHYYSEPDIRIDIGSSSANRTVKQQVNIRSFDWQSHMKSSPSYTVHYASLASWSAFWKQCCLITKDYERMHQVMICVLITKATKVTTNDTQEVEIHAAFPVPTKRICDLADIKIQDVGSIASKTIDSTIASESSTLALPAFSKANVCGYSRPLMPQPKSATISTARTVSIIIACHCRPRHFSGAIQRILYCSYCFTKRKFSYIKYGWLSHWLLYLLKRGTTQSCKTLPNETTMKPRLTYRGILLVQLIYWTNPEK